MWDSRDRDENLATEGRAGLSGGISCLDTSAVVLEPQFPFAMCAAVVTSVEGL